MHQGQATKFTSKAGSASHLWWVTCCMIISIYLTIFNLTALHFSLLAFQELLWLSALLKGTLTPSGSRIQTSNLSVTGPTLLITWLPAAPTVAVANLSFGDNSVHVPMCLQSVQWWSHDQLLRDCAMYHICSLSKLRIAPPMLLLCFSPGIVLTVPSLSMVMSWIAASRVIFHPS